MKRLIVALLFTAALALYAQPEQPICDDNGDCYNRRSATGQMRVSLMPRLLVK